jgi:hypothetical protein
LTRGNTEKGSSMPINNNNHPLYRLGKRAVYPYYIQPIT